MSENFFRFLNFISKPAFLKFALAYAGLAEGFSAAATVKTSGEESLENYAKAKSAAEKSLALEAGLAEGFLIRGWLRRQAD